MQKIPEERVTYQKLLNPTSMRLLPSQEAHYEILISEATSGLQLDFCSDRQRGM
jgi:hypothetical protein